MASLSARSTVRLLRLLAHHPSRTAVPSIRSCRNRTPVPRTYHFRALSTVVPPAEPAGEATDEDVTVQEPVEQTDGVEALESASLSAPTEEVEALESASSSIPAEEVSTANDASLVEEVAEQGTDGVQPVEASSSSTPPDEVSTTSDASPPKEESEQGTDGVQTVEASSSSAPIEEVSTASAASSSEEVAEQGTDGVEAVESASSSIPAEEVSTTNDASLVEEVAEQGTDGVQPVDASSSSTPPDEVSTTSDASLPEEELKQWLRSTSSLDLPQKKYGFRAEDVLNIVRLASDPDSEDAAIVTAASVATWPPRVLLLRIADRLVNSKEFVIQRLLRIAHNNGEEGGISRAAAQLLARRLAEMRSRRPYDDTAPALFAEINRVLERFIALDDHWAEYAHRYRYLSALSEVRYLQSHGRLTEEKRAQIARALLAIVEAAAEKTGSAISAWAELRLARMYEDGTIVPKDGVKVKVHLENAVARGSTSARERLAVELGPLSVAEDERLMPLDNKAALAYANSTLGATRTASLASRWYYRRPNHDEATHQALWGVPSDDKLAADLSAWSARLGLIAHGKVQWAEMLLFDRADLNSGLDLLPRYFEETGSATAADAGPDASPETAHAATAAADVQQYEALPVIAEYEGFRRLPEGTVDVDGRRLPRAFDKLGMSIFEPKDRASTRLERIQAAYDLLKKAWNKLGKARGPRNPDPSLFFLQTLPGSERVVLPLFALATRLMREAKNGEPALPRPEDVDALVLALQPGEAYLETERIPEEMKKPKAKKRVQEEAAAGTSDAASSLAPAVRMQDTAERSDAPRFDKRIERWKRSKERRLARQKAAARKRAASSSPAPAMDVQGDSVQPAAGNSDASSSPAPALDVDVGGSVQPTATETLAQEAAKGAELGHQVGVAGSDVPNSLLQ